MASALSQTRLSLLGCLHDPSDQAAWGEFVERYGRRILRWCRQWKLQEADAQDVTQTVLVRLAERLRTFEYDPARSFRAYLKTLTRYALCDFLEGRKDPARGSGDSRVLDQLADVAAHDDLADRLAEEYDLELFEQAQFQVRLRVDRHTWEAFRLTALEGRSGAEAAAQLGMAVPTVFKAKSKDQKMLQEVVRQLNPESGHFLKRREGRGQSSGVGAEKSALVTAGSEGAYVAPTSAFGADELSTLFTALFTVLEKVSAAGQVLPILDLADSGYYAEQAARELEELGLDPYLATERQRHHPLEPSGESGAVPETAQERMAAKLRTALRRVVYGLRKGIVEPVFGQIKGARGFRRFLLRGLAKVRGEWRLVCLTHNLLKLWRYGCAAIRT